MPGLANLLKSSTFRLTALYLVLFALSVAVILGVVYWNTAVLLERQGDDTINAEISSLSEQYRQGGLAQLVRILRQRSANPSNNVYLLAGFGGARLAGNLNTQPPGLDGRSGWIEFPYTVVMPEGQKRHLARARFFTLSGGFKLVVGRDVEERRRFAGLIRQTLFLSLGFSLGLGLIGGIVLSRGFLRRIEGIGETAQTIMKGDLSERMSVRGTGDELDRLSVSLNEMLEQIESLMTGMREVTDNVAHDLKTPLTRLRAGVEDALRSGSKAQYRAALERTLEEADDLLKTFNALLSITRLEAGDRREGLRLIDASALLHDVAELFEPSAAERGATLDVDAEPGLELRADRQLLSQAVVNLIDNALKYARSDDDDFKPAIKLEARKQGGEIVVTIADNGPGIPERDRERVLNRFVRLDAARSKPGNGLGLSLVAGIVKLHGGEMVLEDNAPGLRVVLKLPAQARSGRRAKSAGRAARRARSAKPEKPSNTSKSPRRDPALAEPAAPTDPSV